MNRCFSSSYDLIVASFNLICLTNRSFVFLVQLFQIFFFSIISASNQTLPLLYLQLVSYSAYHYHYLIISTAVQKKEVKERALYDMLGVEPEASQGVK
jgi:hypothetical protein